ncbi:hypothetical protein BaRGS_00036600 [Batillaria attramentaria]|uniref:Rho-GAP domain-containing protein n=1 Tax=Batillaria attramentaria TaxID=370345 RepID=A0ABD0JBI5_9CAEN
MSSKGRKIAKNLGKSLRKKFDSDSQNDDLQQRVGELNLSSSSPTHLSGAEMRSSSNSAASPSVVGKSTSLSTIGNEPGESVVVDHSEIIALTHDVKNFSDTLAKLKILFIEGLEPGDDARVVSHESLGEVLAVLKGTLQRYSALQSPEIFTAARELISKIKYHNYEEELDEDELQLFLDAIDHLALAFSRSVSEYLMGDIVTQQQLATDTKVRSCDNLMKAQEEEQAEAKVQPKKKLDAVMVGLEAGLDLALQRAKAWSRYTRDIISYIEKKSQLVFCTALSQDAEFASNVQASHAVLHTSKFVEPLMARRTEHDRQDTVNNLRKAQALYVSRQQEYERARETVQKSDGEKLEKRKKLEEEALHKAAEAETTYKACVAEANQRQRALEKTKAELLSKIREQIHLCDQVIKISKWLLSISVFFIPCGLLYPVQYQTLSESSSSYETGCQYAEFIKRLPASASRPCRTDEFTFEPYMPGQKPGEARKISVHSNGSSGEHIHSNEGSPVASPRRDKYRSPVRAWGQTGQPLPQAGGSDTDSASGSTRSHESSPSSSPHNILRRQIVSSQSLDELTEEDMDKMPGFPSVMSETDRNQRGRRNTMFGVDFQEQVERYKSQVPPIITKCLAEIERRGVMIKVSLMHVLSCIPAPGSPKMRASALQMRHGIYRVSGVKSKVESLCRRFDLNPELVDLEEVHPNIISNVLKLYLRQLPEPLLTFRLYADFIHLAKENMAGYLVGDKMVDRLSSLVDKLPPSNFRTCAVLMHHLHRVAAHSDLNQMTSSNLGIVFGPTLLRPLEGTASLASLVDTPHQTRAIELLIINAEYVFGPGDDYQLVPDQTPVEALEDSAESLTIMVPTSSTEPSPEKSPTKKESSEAFATAATPQVSSVTATPSTSSTPATPGVPPPPAQLDDKIPMVMDADDSTPRLEPSAADFSLPGSASNDKYDNVFVENPSTSLADETRTTSESSMTKDATAPSTPKHTLAETAPAPDATLQALQPVATLIDSSTWPGPASRSAVSIPASPTIVPRSSSSGSTGSADGRMSPSKGDPRSDRFKLEQRKLLSAIKSDPKVGIAVGGDVVPGVVLEAGETKSAEQEDGKVGKVSQPDKAADLPSPVEKSDQDVSEKKAEKLAASGTGGSAAESSGKPLETRTSLKEKAESKAKRPERSDVGTKSPGTAESPVRGVKLGTGTARPASGPVTTTRPSSTTAGRVRTSAAAGIQRRSNITGLGGGSGAGSATSLNTGPRSVLTRYPPATSAPTACSAAAARRSIGSQPNVAAAQQRLLAGSPQKQSSTSSPVRHSFESSLRSYGNSSPLSTSEAATALAGNAARTRRISGERSHGSVRDMTAGAQTKTGLTSSPTSSSARTFPGAKATTSGITKTSGVGVVARGAATASTGGSSVTATNTTSSGVTRVSSTSGTTASKPTTSSTGATSSTVPATAAAGRKFHEKCYDSKSPESDSQPQQGATRDLSQDRTPRFV